MIFFDDDDIIHFDPDDDIYVIDGTDEIIPIPPPPLLNVIIRYLYLQI